MPSPYETARETYGPLGVDTEAALETLGRTPISVHCWQGDDVGGFESSTAGDPGGGLAVTGNYPGRARTPQELRADLEKVFSLVPGKHRLNLHAFYLETGGQKVDRDQIETLHFQGWIDWAKSLGIGMDFNPTCFAHPKAADGFTLAPGQLGKAHADQLLPAPEVSCANVVALDQTVQGLAVNQIQDLGEDVATGVHDHRSCKQTL